MILNADSPVFELASSTLKARAQVHTGQFTVLAGSQVQVQGEGRTDDETRPHQQQLIERGHLTLSDRPGIYSLTEGTRFASADEATRMVLGKAGDASSLWTFSAPDGTRTTYGAWLEAQRAGPAAGDPSSPPRFELRSVGVTATAEVRDGQFVVLKGSLARKDVVDSFGRHVPPGYRRVRADLISSGQLQVDSGDGFYIFTEDVVFAGSTPAATVLVGRNADGTREWKRRLPDVAVQTHGEYLALTAGDGSDTPYSFAWLPFFRALATHLLDADPATVLEAFRRAADLLAVAERVVEPARSCPKGQGI